MNSPQMCRFGREIKHSVSFQVAGKWQPFADVGEAAQ